MSRHLPWIHVELVPLFLQVRNLRRFVRDFCAGMSLRPEYAEHIAMAAAELLEVAAKGASAQWARFDLRLLGTFTEVSVTSTPSTAPHAVVSGPCHALNFSSFVIRSFRPRA